MAKRNPSQSTLSGKDNSSSCYTTKLALLNLTGVKESCNEECQQGDMSLVLPVIATSSLTQCTHTLNQDGPPGLSSESSVCFVRGAPRGLPAANLTASSPLPDTGNCKALCSPQTESPVIVKPATHQELLHSTPLYFTDNLETFNVVQEETVPMETRSDEESHSFVPPITSKPQRNESTKSYICGECGKVFAARRNLSRHIKVIHISEQTHSCQVCGKVFRHFHNMTVHKQNQHHFTPNEQHLIKPLKNFECPVCQKTFQYKSNLIAHSRLHSGEKPFKCSYCDRGFVQSSNCKKHELTHTNQRPHRCCHCQKSFTSSCNLQRHQLSHLKVKNFLCPVCGKSFTQRWNLKKHEKRHGKDGLEKPLRPFKSCKTKVTEPQGVTNSANGTKLLSSSFQDA